jgi:polyisoprenoid-binding protein YceI
MTAGLAVLFFSLGSLQPAIAQTRYTAQQVGTSVKVDGTSTAHDWEMEGRMIGGYIEFGQEVKLDEAQTTPPGLKDGKLPVKIHALIPVTSIHAKVEHLPDVMDHLMQEHLKADQFGFIEYTLTEMTFKGPHEPGKPFAFDTTGNLAIAGVTNKVSFPVTIAVLDDGRIKGGATVPLKMTAFKVDPPAPNIGLGLMRCGDDIKIIIDWTLKERKTGH